MPKRIIVFLAALGIALAVGKGAAAAAPDDTLSIPEYRSGHIPVDGQVATGVTLGVAGAAGSSASGFVFGVDLLFGPMSWGLEAGDHPFACGGDECWSSTTRLSVRRSIRLGNGVGEAGLFYGRARAHAIERSDRIRSDLSAGETTTEGGLRAGYAVSAGFFEFGAGLNLTAPIERSAMVAEGTSRRRDEAAARPRLEIQLLTLRLISPARPAP